MGFRRELWSKPLLAAEWNEEYEERAASWWELFVDLILVVTCSAVAESLEEDVSWNGVYAFFVTFSLFFHGWNHYCQFGSRYIDTSLLHSLQLFLYLLATSSMVTNTNGFEYIQHFATSAIWQRCAVVFMLITASLQIPRARGFIWAVICNSLISFCFCIPAALSSSQDVSQILLVIAVLWEGLLSYPVGYVISRTTTMQLIPLNIDHNAERMGCFIMVVLGESIVSALFDYHRRGLDPTKTPLYLTAMALSLSLTFAFGLIYYAVQPPRAEHALRRSALAGICFVVGHWFLSLALLAVGVGVKLAMHTILAPATTSQSNGSNDIPSPPSPLLPPSAAWLLFSATSAALTAILFLRLAHYGGREPKPSDPAQVQLLKNLWWAASVVVILVPVGAGAVIVPSEGGVDPVQALQLVVAIVGGFALAETIAANWVDAVFIRPAENQLETSGEGEDEEPLLPGLST